MVARSSPATSAGFGSRGAYLWKRSLSEPGVHRTYVGSVERAERHVAIDNICQIAWALGVSRRTY